MVVASAAGSISCHPPTRPTRILEGRQEVQRAVKVVRKEKVEMELEEHLEARAEGAGVWVEEKAAKVEAKEKVVGKEKVDAKAGVFFWGGAWEWG